MSPASQSHQPLKNGLSILGKHSLDVPVEHRQLLTHGLGLARACHPKLQNAAQFGGFTRIQSSSSVRGRNHQWLCAYLCPANTCPAPPVCKDPKSSQPFFKHFLRNQRLPELFLPLASFSLCTAFPSHPFPCKMGRVSFHRTQGWAGLEGNLEDQGV